MSNLEKTLEGTEGGGMFSKPKNIPSIEYLLEFFKSFMNSDWLKSEREKKELLKTMEFMANSVYLEGSVDARKELFETIKEMK